MSKYKRQNRNEASVACNEPKLKELKADLVELDIAIADFTALDNAGYLGYGDAVTVIYGHMYLRRQSLISRIEAKKAKKK